MPLVAKRFLSGTGLVLAVVLTGCGGGNVVKVAGTLTYKGKPVPNCTLFFQPEHGRESHAETDEQGRFKVSYARDEHGIEIGKHKVWVMNRAEGPIPGMPAAVSKDLAEFYRKYSQENSKLTVEITSKTRDLPLNLD